jgi:hypothetical protein
MSLMSPVSDTNRKFFFSISSPRFHKDPKFYKDPKIL